MSYTHLSTCEPFTCANKNLHTRELQVQEIQAKASRERMLEADLMLANLADQRQLAAAAADEEVLLRKQQLHIARYCLSV